MSEQHVSEPKDEAAKAGDAEPSTSEPRLATSYLPLWLLLAFAVVVACGVLTN